VNAKCRKLIRWPVLLLLLVVAGLAGCDMKADRTMLIDGDWSRGLRVGIANQRDPVAMDIDSGEQDVYLAWPQRGDAGIEVHFSHLDSEGRLLVSQAVSTGLFFPRSIKLLLDSQGQPHLFTRASTQSGENVRVFHLLVDSQGDLLIAPEAITPPQHDVEAFDIAKYGDGDFALVWQSEHSAGRGIYHIVLDSGGSPIGEPTLVAPNGRSPAIVIEANEVLHLIWVEEPSAGELFKHYAVSSDRMNALTDSVVVAEYSGGTGVIFSPPAIGIDDGHVYVFWSAEFRAGMQPGDSASYYVTFPKGQPRLTTSRQVRLPGVGDLPYADKDAWIEQLWREKRPPFESRTGAIAPPQTGSLNYSQVFGLPPGGARHNSRNIAYPAPFNTDASEMLVLFSVRTEYRMQDDVQPGMALFMDGELIGYQLVARSSSLSWNCTARLDEAGNLYAAWPDMSGEGNYDVYVATTAPALTAGISRLTVKDAALGLVNIAWGMLSGLTLAPLVIMMFFLPLLWIGLVYIFGSDDSLLEWGPRIAFLIAALLYYAGKLVLFSTVLAFPPLMGAVPEQFREILQFSLPVAILALAFGVLLIYARRSEKPILFWGFFTFALSDALFTMLLYGPGFFG